MHEHGFWLDHLIRIFPALEQIPDHVFMATVVVIIVLATTSVARMQLKHAMAAPDGALIPDEKLTYRNFFEIITEKLYALTETVIGPHDASTYFPIVGALFVYVFTSNLVGLIPGLLPPTENLNTTLALGIFVFIYYNYIGLKTHGLAYLKHFMGPVIWLAPIMTVIEIFSHLSRPFSLGLRLRGNITGDHVVLSMFHDMVPYLVPVIFYGLGVFVCFMQAFVFCLMTMVYISLASAHDH